MSRIEGDEAGWVELESPGGGCRIALHQASKSQKSGAAIKLVFGIEDVGAFKRAAELKGLKFGPVHTIRKGAGHQFANAKDPAGNAISISSRGIRAGVSQRQN